MTARSATYLLSLVVLLAACDLTPDDRHVGIAAPPPFYVVDTSLEEGTLDVALNQPITLQFSRHLDADSFRYFDAVVLSSGGVRARGFSRYRMTDQTLTFFPTRNLRRNLVYTLTINPDTLRSIAGEPLVEPFVLTFQTSREDRTVEQEGRPIASRSFTADVAPIFRDHCGECHGASEVLHPLTYERLFESSAQTNPPRPLVLPYAPTRSYLMSKILPDYPDRQSTVMPPPWSEAATLSPGQLEVVETWILTGAEP